MGDFHEKKQEELTETTGKLMDLIMHNYEKKGLLATMEQLYKEVEQAKETSGMNAATSCGKACSFCCHDEIMLSEMEALYILHKIDVTLADKQLLEIQNTGDGDVLKLPWAQRKCSMLDEEGNCKIYEHRPLICRTHNSTEDPIYCHLGKYPTRGHHQLFSVPTESVSFALMMLSDLKYRKLHEVLFGENKTHIYNPHE